MLWHGEVISIWETDSRGIGMLFININTQNAKRTRAITPIFDYWCQFLR